jgi:DNA polymerase III subunit delta'
MTELELQLPDELRAATEHQPRARLALAAALAAGASHAYLFKGPTGVGKRATARAFAAEILSGGAGDPDDAKRRALLDPSPHPDLVWVAPSGSQHMVEEIRERVIRAAAYRPFEGSRRVFVIEQAEAMRDESQNALLKTLEEPPPFAHLVLLSSEPDALLETITSRCQQVEFGPLPPEAVAEALAGLGDPDEVQAAARLAGGDPERARMLLSEPGRGLRAAAEDLARAARSDQAGGAPWRELLAGAESAGADAEAAARASLQEQSEAGRRISAREMGDEARRIGRRHRTEVLDLGLGLCAAWYRDLGVVAAGAPDAVLAGDRLEELTADATGLDATRARRAVELVQDTRRRLDLNVSEELALEALFFRAQRLLAGGP